MLYPRLKRRGYSTEDFDKQNEDPRSLRNVCVDAGLGSGKLSISGIPILSGMPDAVPRGFDPRDLTGGATPPLRVSPGFGGREPSFEQKLGFFMSDGRLR